MSETSEKFIDKVIETATSRLKIPIISTYIIVLIFHNWDLVYYLLFQSGEATTKIVYIKKNFPNYWERVFDALFFAIIVLVVFTLVDLILSIALKTVYKAKKKVNDEVNEYKRVEELQNVFKEQNKEIKKLKEALEKNNETIDSYFTTINDLKYELKDYDNTIDSNKHLFNFTKLISDICSIDTDNQKELMWLFTLIVEELCKDYIKDEDLTSSSNINKLININQVHRIKEIYFILDRENYIIITSIDEDILNIQILDNIKSILKIMKFIS